uniref:Uncharacterized protein n=1 Tax=Rhizophora mucronata TaxID=61149 RepID=A0A2P2QJI7_RHIMU
MLNEKFPFSNLQITKLRNSNIIFLSLFLTQK